MVSSTKRGRDTVYQAESLNIIHDPPIGKIPAYFCSIWVNFNCLFTSLINIYAGLKAYFYIFIHVHLPGGRLLGVTVIRNCHENLLDACYKTGVQNQNLIRWHINNNYNNNNNQPHFPQGIIASISSRCAHVPPSLPALANSQHKHFLSLMANSRGWEHLSCQMPRYGNELTAQWV